MALPRVEIPKLAMCRGCGYVACCCDFKKAHPEGCGRRRAVLDEHPVPCGSHGVYACELCNPCTCAAASGDTPGKVIELFDALKGALGKTGSR